MPTPSEQKALAFVAIVILLGGAVRVLRAGSFAPPTTLEQQAIARQASAADSATRTAKHGKTASRRKSSRQTRDTMPRVVAGVASVPGSFARPDDPFSHTPYGLPPMRAGFSPPSARIDTDIRGLRPASSQASAPRYSKPVPTTLIDLDRASATEIEALPRVGPALANRIVASRDSLGPFGSLQALRRVKGLGAASVARLAPLVSFGGRPATP